MTKSKPTVADLASAIRDVVSEAEDALDLIDDLDIDVPGDAEKVAHRALSLCERCAGLPELSINRCPVCRCLAKLISE